MTPAMLCILILSVLTITSGFFPKSRFHAAILRVALVLGVLYMLTLMACFPPDTWYHGEWSSGAGVIVDNPEYEAQKLQIVISMVLGFVPAILGSSVSLIVRKFKRVAL